MAAGGACKRVGRLRTSSCIGSVNGITGFGASKLAYTIEREMYDLFTASSASSSLAMQAEAITAAIAEVLNDSLENVSQSFVSKGEMQKIEMSQERKLSKFKSEVQSSQGHHFSLLGHETEKLRSDIKKMHSELKHEIDKVTAGQRLDLNLERGRIRDELANQNAETTNLTNKLDREIHALRAQLEAAIYDVIKY